MAGIVVFVGLVAAAIIFRKYIDITDVYISIAGALGLAVIYFLWRNHWAVFRIYKAQASKLDDHEKEMLPKVFLNYNEKTCRRETHNTDNTRIFYFSVEVSCPPSAIVKNVRVFLHQIERQIDSKFESIGIEGGPSLAWTATDNAPDDTYMPATIGPGHTRIVNIFFVPITANRMNLCTKVRHNRELDLLRESGLYKFIIRANCDGWNGYAELFLLVMWSGWGGDAQTMKVEPETYGNR